MRDPPRGSALADLLGQIDIRTALEALGKGESDEFITRKQVADMLSVTPRTVDIYVQRGLLTPLRIRTSRLTRFRKRDVIALLQPIVK